MTELRAAYTVTVMPSVTDDTVTVVIDRRMARLLARLQQVANLGGVATVDLDAWTLELHGRKEYLAPRS